MQSTRIEGRIHAYQTPWPSASRDVLITGRRRFERRGTSSLSVSEHGPGNLTRPWAAGPLRVPGTDQLLMLDKVESASPRKAWVAEVPPARRRSVFVHGSRRGRRAVPSSASRRCAWGSPSRSECLASGSRSARAAPALAPPRPAAGRQPLRPGPRMTIVNFDTERLVPTHSLDVLRVFWLGLC